MTVEDQTYVKIIWTCVCPFHPFSGSYTRRNDDKYFTCPKCKADNGLARQEDIECRERLRLQYE